MIKIKRVLLRDEDNSSFISEEWIRGDMVRGVRHWHKSEKDATVDGDMCQVTLLDYETKLPIRVRIAESAEAFALRLYDHKRDSANRRPVTKQAS